MTIARLGRSRLLAEVCSEEYEKLGGHHRRQKHLLAAANQKTIESETVCYRRC